MRACTNCRTPDRPQIDCEIPCSCDAERYEPEAHDADCKALIHEVNLYVVRILKADLTPSLELSSYYLGLGWRLKQDGNRYYRGKYLCHACIQADKEAQARKAEYKRLCREASGITDQTYAQMIAQALN